MREYEDIQQTGFFTKVYKSITNLDEYNNFLKMSFGKSVLYLLLISLILGLVSGFKYAYDYNKGILQMIYVMKEKAPEFRLSNGELNVEGKMPIVITYNTDEVLYIDTSGNNIEEVINGYNTGIFITKEKIVQKQSNSRTQITSFSTFQGVNFTKSDLINFMSILKYGAVVIVIFTPLFFFIGKFISGFFVALLALIINSLFIKSNVRFGDIFKLSFYAMTLSMILKTISIFIPAGFPLLGWLYYIISVIYLCLALKTIRNNYYTKVI